MRMKKWDDRKDFNFSHFYLIGSEKSGGMEKVSLYKFTHIPLLKIDGQLKPKNDKQPKIKREATSRTRAHTHTGQIAKCKCTLVFLSIK